MAERDVSMPSGIEFLVSIETSTPTPEHLSSENCQLPNLRERDGRLIHNDSYLCQDEACLAGIGVDADRRIPIR